MVDAEPIHRGSCHCGAVRIEARGRLEGLEICNCSLCHRGGYVQWHVAPERFRLVAGEEVLRDYRFGTRTSHNTFCSICGMAPFRRSRSDPDKVTVNVRCLEDVDATLLPARRFDGRCWERALADRSGPPVTVPFAPAGAASDLGERLAVRRMAAAELEPVVRLWQRTKLETEPWRRLATERGYSFQDNLAYLRDRLLPRCEVDVALVDGRLAGFNAQAAEEIELLFVDPYFHGAGVGSALLARARQRSPGHLALWALRANHRACRFYERRGFTAVAFGTSPPPESQPDVRYEWRPAGPARSQGGAAGAPTA